MENKINIAELLKNCPKGMELDCVLYEDCKFLDIDAKSNSYLIRITTPCGIKYLDKYGCYTTSDKSKCVIFPKGKTTWEGFQRPFKDGDVLSYQFSGFKNRSIYIYMYHPRMNTTYYVAVSGDTNSEFMINDKEGHALNGYSDTVRFATEEEKSKLFQAIKDNGYKWNEETKTLEKLVKPIFNIGDKIKRKNCRDHRLRTIESINNNYYIIKTPDWFDNCYITDKLPFEYQNEYELAHMNKFDINTLKPFESRVLVRDTYHYEWEGAVFGRYDGNSFFTIGGTDWKYCIPYEGNEHLLGTTNDCSDYYKTWE